MAGLTPQEVEEKIKTLAASMRQRGLATSDLQARERARDIVMQEIRMQASFEQMKNDPALNPQQTRPKQISDEEMRKAGGMLKGDEFPKEATLAQILKGRSKEQK